MPLFHVTAYTAESERVRRTVRADDASGAARLLERDGLEPDTIRRAWWAAPELRRRPPLGELLQFNRMLASMLRSRRVTEADALDVLLDSTEHAGMRAAIEQMSRQIKSGRSLAAAVRSQEAIFGPTYAGVVAAGEASGNLEGVLERVADRMELNQEIRNETLLALVHPAAMLLIALAGMAAVLIFVAPVFQRIYAESGAELPAFTRLLIGAGRAARILILPVGAGLFAAGMLAPRLWRSEAVREPLDRVLLRMPVVGRLLVASEMARFCGMMATLLASRVRSTDALRLAAGSLDSALLRRAALDAAGQVAGGARLDRALGRAEGFPRYVVKLAETGDASGELAEQFGHGARFYEGDFRFRVKRGTKLLEPAMTVVMGLVIGIMVTGLYLPLFRMIRVIRGAATG